MKYFPCVAVACGLSLAGNNANAVDDDEPRAKAMVRLGPTVEYRTFFDLSAWGGGLALGAGADLGEVLRAVHLHPRLALQLRLALLRTREGLSVFEGDCAGILEGKFRFGLSVGIGAGFNALAVPRVTPGNVIGGLDPEAIGRIGYEPPFHSAAPFVMLDGSIGLLIGRSELVSAKGVTLWCGVRF